MKSRELTKSEKRQDYRLRARYWSWLTNRVGGNIVCVVVGFGFGWYFRGEPPIQEVRAASLLVSEKPIHTTQETSRIPASLLDRKVSKLRVGESGWVLALHFRVDREGRAWVDPNALCFEHGGSFASVMKVAKGSDGLHLYVQKEAIGWTTLGPEGEPNSDWLALKIHPGVNK